MSSSVYVYPLIVNFFYFYIIFFPVFLCLQIHEHSIVHANEYHLRFTGTKKRLNIIIQGENRSFNDIENGHLHYNGVIQWTEIILVQWFFYEHLRMWDGPTLLLNYRGQKELLRSKFDVCRSIVSVLRCTDKPVMYHCWKV